ncbi:hypothetical protein OTU49_006672 [Cherax quadricarinatus]|uniref:PPM-type phosphatase domain-containing protein n=2 Tax=Cherax quadricarinatus TaxID=27406 RepID=A0AAW0X095_CHEQU
MFIKSDMFDKLLCCRRKVIDDDDDDDRVVEEVVLQHTNNNKTEYISSAQLVEKLKGGTTAVVALVREKRLVVAWLGDSQALLVRRRHPLRMVEPHKPELPLERERVEEMGGCVINIQGTWRVLGQLAVSRAIGDREYKPYVSSECDIKSLEIEGDEDFLILACDGLWDTLTPEAAVNVVYAYLTHNDGDTEGVGRCLVEAARNKGSEDNITAVVVFLRPVATLMEEEAQRLAQGQVPDPVPAVVLSKDSTPSSINAIFSPPINQFEYNSPTIPTYNPFETESPLGEAYNEYNMETEAAAAPTSLEFKHGEEPMEGSEAPQVGAHDSDSDEAAAAAAGAQGVAQPFNLHDAPTPTAEEVDAALAELDSIPDGVCESGDVEEEEEEEEEWSYYRMEPQTQPQSEDVLVPGSAAAALQPSEAISQAADKVDDQDSLIVAELNKDQPEGYLELTKGEFEDNLEPKELIRDTQSQELFHGFQEQSVDQVVFQEPSTDELVFQDQLGKQLDLQGQSREEFATLKERPQDKLDLSVDLEKAQSKLMDGLQFQPKEQSSPTEADRTLVMESSSDILQTSTERPFNFEVTSDGASLMETSMVKTPDGIGSSIEPASPHGSISPHIPGSPRSVEGFVTSVELNAPEESFGTNFAINQSQDLFVGAVDQPSGPFSVYVSSSPEPASLDPSLQTTMDIVNVSEGVANGLVDDDIKVSQPEDFSPVEIVHAQSTVEVVAPPSPVDNREPEMQFTIPEQMQELSSPAQIPADLSLSSDITFIPEPVVEPVAEVPVPVYIEGNTPVSEGETEDLDISTEEIKTEEIISAKDQIPEIEKHDDLTEDTKIEEMVCIRDQIPEVEKHDDLTEDTKIEEMVSTRDQIPEVEMATLSNTDTVPATKDETRELSEVVKAPVESEMDVEIKSETVVLDKNETITTIDSEIINAATVNGILDESPAVNDVVISAVTETVPVDVTLADGEKESEMLKVDATVAKSDKTPAKGTPVKSPFKSGKATPGRAVPSKSTPTRSPSTRTAEKKSPVTRTTAVPGKPAVEKSSTIKPATTKPVTKPATTKPTLTKPTNTRLATRPTPRTATARPPTTTPPPPPKAMEKRIAKPSTPTAPRAASSRPSAAAAAAAATASKVTPARPTPAARTMTKRPVTAPSKTTEKPDDGTVRKAAPRPTTAPRTTTATTNTTTTTTARKAATASTKSAAEKETKNTTNRILSTSRPAPKPLAGTTKPTPSKTSTARTTSVTNAKATSKVNGTSTSTSKPKTTSTTRSATAKSTGVTARRTVVSKTKTSATGGKVESVKAGKAEVIETIQPVVNGENKIADEETSVEVIEKCVVEDIMQASTEKVFTESSHIMTTSEQVVTTETTEVIVNGDH